MPSGRPDQNTLNTWAGFADENMAATFEAELAEARKQRGAQQFFPTERPDDQNDDTFGGDDDPDAAFREGYEDEREHWNAPEVLAGMSAEASEGSRMSRFVSLEEGQGSPQRPTAAQQQQQMQMQQQQQQMMQQMMMQPGMQQQMPQGQGGSR